MFLALDIASDKANYCLLDQEGDIQDEGVMTRAMLRLALVGGPFAKNPLAAAAMEYTGRLAKPWAELLLASEVPAYYVHSTDRKAHSRIAGQSQKTDPADARMLAHLLYVWVDPERRRIAKYRDHLLISAERIREAWELRSLVAAANKAVAARVATEQRAIAAARSGSEELAQAWREAGKTGIPELSLGIALKLAQEKFPAELRNLQTIPGVGPHTALTLIAYLSPAERFVERQGGRDLTRANLKRYAGMHPRLSQSGAMAEKPRMSKAGSPHIRAACWVAARSAIPTKSLVGELYARHVAAGVRPGLSLQRVAAHILVIAHQVMITGKEYEDPMYPKVVKPGKPQGTLTQAEASRELGISRQRINQLIHEGQLATVTHGGKRYVKQVDIARRLEHSVESQVTEGGQPTIVVRYTDHDPESGLPIDRESGRVTEPPTTEEGELSPGVSLVRGGPFDLVYINRDSDDLGGRPILEHEQQVREDRYQDGE